MEADEIANNRQLHAFVERRIICGIKIAEQLPASDARLHTQSVDCLGLDRQYLRADVAKLIKDIHSDIQPAFDRVIDFCRQRVERTPEADQLSIICGRRPGSELCGGDGD